MGEFEELVDKAASGDDSAATLLKEKYSGTALREKAEKADSLEKRLAEMAPLARQARFQEISAELPEDLRDVEFSLDDLGDMPPEEITLDLMKSKVRDKKDKVAEARLQTARANGFDTVEEFDKALKSVKEQQTANRSAMEKVGGATASRSGGTPTPDEPSTPWEAGKRDFNLAKQQGATDDVALGEALHSIMATQRPIPLEE